MKLKTTIALAAITITNIAFAAYPDKPIKLIIPFAPNGTTDLVVKSILDPLSKELGQPIIVENIGGQGGVVGTMQILNSDNDGYTLGITTTSTHTTNPAYQVNLGYHPINDFTHIGNIANTPNIISVNKNFSANNYKEFLDLLSKSKGKHTYATPGLGGTHHLLMENYKSIVKVSVSHIPYRGAGPALKDTSDGKVDIMFDNLPSSLAYIQEGKLKPIVIASPNRISHLPNVPTFKEIGLDSMNRTVFFGLTAPPETSDEAVNKISQALKVVLAKPEVKEKLEKIGAFADFKTPEEQKKMIENDYNAYVNIVKEQKLSIR